MVIETEKEIIYDILERTPHEQQKLILDSTSKRKVIRAGRRGGKTVAAAIMAVRAFLDGKRVLYTAPTTEQVEKFWFEVNWSLAEPIAAGVLSKNETEHVIEREHTENRIRAKTAWNANTLRGDYADLLIFDEYQLTDEDAWEVVGAPMLIDHNGDAVFIYTPPSLRSAGVSKARDPRHAAKMFKAALADTTGRWATFHFTSHDNPHISKEALAELIHDMSKKSYRQEIQAEDDEVEISWLVWGTFNEKVCKIPRFEIPKSWIIHTAHDFGPANPAALFIAQDPGTGNFYVYREYLPGGGRSPYEHTEAFKEITKGYNVLSRTGGSPQEEENRQAYGAQGWPITASKIKHVKPQIDKVIGLMELNKIYIFDDLSNLLEEIYNCLWKLDKDGVVTNEIANEARYHLSACMRYKFSDFTPETVQTSEPSTSESSWA